MTLKPTPHREAVTTARKIAAGLRRAARQHRAAARRLRQAATAPGLSASEARDLRRRAFIASKLGRRRARRAKVLRGLARIMLSGREPEGVLAKKELRDLLAAAPGGVR